MQRRVQRIDEAMDVLGQVLAGTRLLASTMNILDVGAPWGIEFRGPKSHLAIGVVILDGPCWIESATLPLTKLEPGDSVLVLRGAEHRISSSPEAPTVGFDAFLDAHHIERLDLEQHGFSPLVVRGGNGEIRTRLLSYGLLAQDVGPNSLIANLPDTILLRANETDRVPWIPATVEFLTGETVMKPGYVAVATKLVELIFTGVVREHVLTSPTAGARWMQGLRNPGVGRAIACIHSRPGESWTVGSLARQAGMARSTFARYFAKVMQQSPIDYLIDHRMQLACSHLCVDERSVADVAEAAGYRSERAFRQAFKTRFGVAPSHYVRSIRQEHSADNADGTG